jgi:alpha-ketoglutarate-dependent taurine dioxygenase
MVDTISHSTQLKTIDYKPLVGTEIKTDLEALLSGKCAKQIRALLDQRGVLVVRDVPMDDQQQKAFSQTLGEIDPQILGEEFLNISLDRSLNRGAEYVRSTIYWHIDRIASVPHLAVILTPRKLSDVGGETEFANTYAAWEALPEDEKREYEGLRVVHALEASLLMITPEPSLAELEGWRTEPAAERPLVWTHRSGRKSLLIGATALQVLGKSAQESRYILTKLRDWATQRQFVYQHKWQMGDLLIWDNTGMLHRALPYSKESGRLLRRTSLAGEEPVA